MTKYEAGANDVEAIRACAETYGFCLVRNVFDEAELAQLKGGMRELDAEFGKLIPDIMSCAPLNWLITDARVLNIARTLLGEELVYYPESSVNYEAEAGPMTLNPFNTLHCDATGMPDDRMKIWRNPTDRVYRGYRFGLYFQDYGRLSGGLKVGIGTHKGDPDSYLRNDGLDTGIRTPVEVLPGRVMNIAPAHAPLYDVPARPGDLVVWNLRTIHAAGFRALKNHPGLSLHPRMESKIAANCPEALREVAAPRLALFFDFAAPAEDIDLYIKSRIYLLNREAAGKLLHARYDAPEIAEKLRAHGITARYDHLLFFMLMNWISAPERRPKIAARMFSLADRHRDFSPHFSLFDREAYASLRGRDDDGALGLVLDGITAQSAVFRKKTMAVVS